MHNKAPAVTYPDDDSVISLKFGEKQVPAHDLRLVQRPKATQHFYVALRWDIGHCADSRRRKDAAAFCWGERDAAGATGRGPWRVGPKRTTSGAHWLRPSSPRGLWRGWTGFFFFFFFFYPDGLRRAAICLCAAGWCFLVAVRRAKLDVRAQNDSLHHWQQRLRCCSVLLVALFDAVSLSLSLSLSLLCYFFFSLSGAAVDARLGRVKVRCCWKGSEVKLPQRPLQTGRGRAWSASASLKWYPRPSILTRQTRGRKPEPRAAASHPSRAVTDGFITLCKKGLLPGPAEAVTNHHSHILAPLWCLTVFLIRLKKPLWECGGDYWLTDEFRLHLGGALHCLMTLGWCSTMSSLKKKNKLPCAF